MNFASISPMRRLKAQPTQSSVSVVTREVMSVFAQALTAPAAATECYVLYFEAGGAPQESQAALLAFASELLSARRPRLWSSGTDRAGNAELNDKLSLDAGRKVSATCSLNPGGGGQSWKPSGVASAILWCRPPMMSMSRRTGARRDRQRSLEAIPAEQKHSPGHPDGG